MIFSQNSLEKQGICTSEIISKTCISKTEVQMVRAKVQMVR